jgi:hypothetical protein
MDRAQQGVTHDGQRCDNIRVFAQDGQVHLNFERERFPGFGSREQPDMEITASLALSPDVARKLADAIGSALAEASPDKS